MLRNIFVFAIIAIGIAYATQGPFYALLFYLWNAYFRPEQWVWGDTVSSLNLSFIIGIYLVAAAILAGRSLRVNSRTGLLLVFALQSAVSTIWSEHFDRSFFFLVEFSKVLLVSYLIVTLVTDRRRLRLTLVVIALSLGFECAKQGWAQLLLNPGAQNNNTIPFLGDNNGVALGTMMLIPIFTALAQTADRRWERYLHRFFAVGVFLRGITTYSRGGFLAAGALGGLALLRSPRKIRALLAVAALALIVSAVMPPAFWTRMSSIMAPTEERDESARGRLYFWEIAQTMAAAKPLTGVGLQGFSASYETYSNNDQFAGERAVHSIWFGALAELGYPGLFLFVTIWLVALWSCVQVERYVRKRPDDRDLRAYAIALETSLIVFAVAGTFLADQYNEMFWHFIGLSTALRGLAPVRIGAENDARAPAAAIEPVLGP